MLLQKRFDKGNIALNSNQIINVKDINNKLNELLKYNKLKKNHYKGANSFIKIEKKGLNNL